MVILSREEIDRQFDEAVRAVAMVLDPDSVDRSAEVVSAAFNKVFLRKSGCVARGCPWLILTAV